MKARPHYYSERKEEYAHIRFNLDMGRFTFTSRDLPLDPSALSTLVFGIGPLHEDGKHQLTLLVTDLSSLFTWNTKQVFVYVSAIYPPSLSDPYSSSKSDANFEPASQAIIWDAILAAPSEPWHQNQYVYPRIKESDKPAEAGENKYANYVTGTDSDAKDRKVKDGKVPSSSKKLGILRLGNQRPKYQITDMTGQIAGRSNATLQLGWNVQPWVGALRWRKGPKLMSGRMVDAHADGEGVGGVYSSESFDFPLLKEKAGAADTGTVKGGEKNRGMPA